MEREKEGGEEGCPVRISVHPLEFLWLVFAEFSVVGLEMYIAPFSPPCVQ